MTSTSPVVPAAQGSPVAASGKPVILVTGADLAPQAVEILQRFEIVYAGKTPDEDSLVELCKRTQPVGIIVRYGKVSARIMDASARLRVISKHGVGIDTIDSRGRGGARDRRQGGGRRECRCRGRAHLGPDPGLRQGRRTAQRPHA